MRPSSRSAFCEYDALVAKEDESAEPVIFPFIGPETDKDPVITTFPIWVSEPVEASEPLIIGLSIIIFIRGLF